MARYYPWIGIGAGLIFLVLVLYGPLEEDTDTKGLLWKKDWAVIEYEEAGRPPVRLMRQGSLFKDEYFVETLPVHLQKPGDETAAEASAAQSDNGNYTRRRGGPAVTNLFNDWRAAQLKAYYTVEDAAKLAELGLTEPGATVRLYAAPDAEPVVIKAGTVRAGNRYVTSTYADHAGLVLLIPDYLITRLQQPAINFREKRLVEFQAKSYTGELEISGDVDGDGQAESVVIQQEREEREGSSPVIKWFRVRDGERVELPLNVASPLDAAVKGVNIDRFRDDPEMLQEAGDAEALWKRSQPAKELTLRLQLTGDGDVTFVTRVRPVPDGVEGEAAGTRALVQSELEPGTDWTRRANYENTLDRLKQAVKYEPPPENHEPPASDKPPAP